MNEAVEYIEYDFETEFDQETKYRGPPTPQLENAWENLLERKSSRSSPRKHPAYAAILLSKDRSLTTPPVNPVPFPEDKLPLVNRTNGMRNEDKLARLDDGHGDVAANFEVFHQLHCLVRFPSNHALRTVNKDE